MTEATPRCKTCRHWNNVDQGREFSQGICRVITGGLNTEGSRPTYLLMPSPAFDADCLTPHHFGCILHEPLGRP